MEVNSIQLRALMRKIPNQETSEIILGKAGDTHDLLHHKVEDKWQN